MSADILEAVSDALHAKLAALASSEAADQRLLRQANKKKGPPRKRKRGAPCTSNEMEEKGGA